jgi:hypothetical protein
MELNLGIFFIKFHALILVIVVGWNKIDIRVMKETKTIENDSIIYDELSWLEL